MKVAFIGHNPQDVYSGGRIHALTLAYAFAKIGYEVDYYTDNIPVFFYDLPDDDKRHKIRFIINKLYLWSSHQYNYKHLIIVPHLASRKSFIFDRFCFYPFVEKLNKKNQSYLWYLDFESPNWIQEVIPTMRPMSAYKYSNIILKDCDVILSTTNIGKKYAQQYFRSYNDSLHYYQLYLSININAASSISIEEERQKKVVFFGRFGLKHKNPLSLEKIIGALPSGYELIIIGKKESIPPEFLDKIEDKCQVRNINIVFLKNITDKEKFKVLSESKLLIFSSKFEGYGIPPLEAQYMGTTVLCSELPVLKEVNPYAYFTDFDDERKLMQDLIYALENPVDCNVLRKHVESFATIDSLTNNLEVIINTIENKFK